VRRVVLDPGVLVSAVLSRSGPPAKILDRWRDAEFDLVVSPKLLDELEGVLLRPKFSGIVAESDARAYVDALAGEGVLVLDAEHVQPLTRDPGDDDIVALAVAAESDAIVSGDADLVELEDPPVPLLTPHQFVERLERS
jgi:putative PIN family toxin of toxin-antitoxin system